MSCGRDNRGKVEKAVGLIPYCCWLVRCGIGLGGKWLRYLGTCRAPKAGVVIHHRFLLINFTGVDSTKALLNVNHRPSRWPEKNGSVLDEEPP